MGCTSSAEAPHKLNAGKLVETGVRPTFTKGLVRPSFYDEPDGKEFHSLTCTPTSSRNDLVDGQPLPPDMKMTRDHRRKLKKFLAEVQKHPVEFMADVQWARVNTARLSGPSSMAESDHSPNVHTTQRLLAL
mmetsp:Transcript_22929/g.42149  ORF Transcript_22929/g.42149 Transcript_22929/m.42149 type:complete len:132 (+) Transcript_22929:71-466(+)